MGRIFGAIFSLAAVGLVVGACAPTQPEFAFRVPPSARGQTCDVASAKVTTFGRSTAKLYAEVALKQQVSDLRGYMFQSGLRRIHQVQQTSDCGHAGVVAGLYQCTARAQMCGR